MTSKKINNHPFHEKKLRLLTVNAGDAIGGGVYLENELNGYIKKNFPKIKITQLGIFKEKNNPQKISLEVLISFADEVIFKLSSLRKIKKAIKANDLIHFHYLSSFSSLTPFVIARILKKPIIATQHGNLYSNSEMVNLVSRTIFFFRSLVIANSISLWADRIVFLTKGQQLRYEKFTLFKKALLGKSIIIPNFISKDWLLEENKKVNKKTKIIFVGRLSYWKGFHDLIKLPKLFPDIDFIIIGKDKKKSLLEDLNHEMSINKNIFYTKEVPRENMTKYYDKADILILPSYTEVFPMTILEAMARGLVILVSDISGMREIVKEGRNGYLFPPGDIEEMRKIITFLKDNPEEVKRISQNNLNDINNFLAEKQVPKYIEIYKEVYKQKVNP